MFCSCPICWIAVDVVASSRGAPSECPRPLAWSIPPWLRILNPFSKSCVAYSHVTRRKENVRSLLLIQQVFFKRSPQYTTVCKGVFFSFVSGGPKLRMEPVGDGGCGLWILERTSGGREGLSSFTKEAKGAGRKKAKRQKGGFGN